MKGMISDVISFSLNDGPGLRTTVFFKGCPLRCRWCHNPETHRMAAQCLYLEAACAHCGACAQVCPRKGRGADGSWIDASACIGCGACAQACPNEASRINGREMTAAEVLRQTARDLPFYRNGGGVTFSGGEPLMQIDFLEELLRVHREAGIHTALETTGYAPWESLWRIIPLVDLFLLDWKHTNPQQHRAWTGVDNALIRENLLQLDRAGAEIILRCPVIPGVNDSREHFEGIGELTHACRHIRQVDLLPYHAVGNSKREQLGLGKDGFTVPEEETVRSWHEQLRLLCAVPVCR